MLIYGKAARSLGVQLKYPELAAKKHPGMSTEECLKWSTAMAQEKIATFFSGLKGAHRYIERTKELAYEQGYVESILGRRRTLPELMTWNLMIEHRMQAKSRGGKLCWCDACQATRKEERRAVNHTIQCSAADVCMLAMLGIRNDPELHELQYRLLLQIHDELLGKCPDENVDRALEIKQWHMENCGLRLRVPLRAKPRPGNSWREAKG